MKRSLVVALALLATVLIGVAVAQNIHDLSGGLRIVKYSQTLNPTADTTNLPLFVATSFAQTFTVTGLQTSDTVFVNGPGTGAANFGCPMIKGRVSAANTLSLEFAKQTTATCTPATGTYVIYAIRSAP